MTSVTTYPKRKKFRHSFFVVIVDLHDKLWLGRSGCNVLYRPFKSVLDRWL